MNRITGIIVVLILLVAMPIGFYLYFHSKTPTPPPAPPELFPAPAFTLLDQHGDTVTNDRLEGYIYVADFFFTSCKTICPMMSRIMSDVQKNYKDQPRVRLASFTVNPEVDSVSVLRDYAERYGALKNKWFFLTHPDPTYLRDSIVVGGFKVPAVPDDADPGQFTHTDRFIIVDGDGIIRGLFDVMKEGQIDSMYNHIERLLVEKKRSEKHRVN